MNDEDKKVVAFILSQTEGGRRLVEYCERELRILCGVDATNELLRWRDGRKSFAQEIINLSKGVKKNG